MRSYISLTKVFLKPLNVSLKGFIIRVKYEFKNKAKETSGVMKELIDKSAILNQEITKIKS